MSDRPIAAIAALSILLVATCGCSNDETPLDYDLPEGVVLDQPPARGVLRWATFGTDPVSDDPSKFASVFVNGPDYVGMEDNDLRGFLDGNFKYAWNQATQTHVRVGRRGEAPRFGEHELFRVVYRWDGIRLPAHATVERASLTLTVEEGPNTDLRLMLYAVRKDWNPGGGGVLGNNVSPPAPGEVWWNDRAFAQHVWGLPGAGFAADGRDDTDTPAMPLAEAHFVPGAEKIVFDSPALAAYATERVREGVPLLFLLKLGDFQEDLPGSLIKIWSGNQGDTRNLARRPALRLDWRSSAQLESYERAVLLEHGRTLSLPSLRIERDQFVAWTFESEEDRGEPTIEWRRGDQEITGPWSRMTSVARSPEGWLELRLHAVHDPVVLGQEFTSELADTEVATGPPEGQDVAWRFVSPTGVEHRVLAQYAQGYRWFVRFRPDELGPWRYSWTHRFNLSGFSSPWGTFDVVLDSRDNASKQMQQFLGELKQAHLAGFLPSRERWTIRFNRLERAAMLLETPESFASDEGQARRALLNEIRAVLGGSPVPAPIPMIADRPHLWEALR